MARVLRCGGKAQPGAPARTYPNPNPNPSHNPNPNPKLGQARELGWDGKNPPPSAGLAANGICGVFAKCFGGGGDAGAEARRLADFARAVRAYDWDTAQALATTAEARADV